LLAKKGNKRDAEKTDEMMLMMNLIKREV